MCFPSVEVALVSLSAGREGREERSQLTKTRTNVNFVFKIQFYSFLVKNGRLTRVAIIAPIVDTFAVWIVKVLQFQLKTRVLFTKFAINVDRTLLTLRTECT